MHCENKRKFKFIHIVEISHNKVIYLFFFTSDNGKRFHKKWAFYLQADLNHTKHQSIKNCKIESPLCSDPSVVILQNPTMFDK